MPAQVLPAEAKPLAILGLQNMPAGPAECPVVCFRVRTKSKSQFRATKRSAGAELGAAAKKLRSGAVSDGTAAPARLASLSRGAQFAPEAMGTHLSTFSFSVAQVSDIWSRVGAAGFPTKKTFLQASECAEDGQLVDFIELYKGESLQLVYAQLLILVAFLVPFRCIHSHGVVFHFCFYYFLMQFFSSIFLIW